MNPAVWRAWLRAWPWLLASGACEIPDRPITETATSGGGSAGTSMAGVDSGAVAGVDDGANGGAPDSAGNGGAAGSAGKSGAAGSGGPGGSGGGGGVDACPDDSNKTAPGKCGCGAPDVDTADGAGCVPLQIALLHRYSFEGDANDSVGTAHGLLKDGATISGGALVLAGGSSNQYLDLPNGLISSLTDATFEAWVTWAGAADGMWQHVFDFGSSNMAEGVPGVGQKYLFLTTDKFRACYTSATPPSEIYVDLDVQFPTTAGTHVAVVINTKTHRLSLYLNGDSTESVPLNLPLSAINDVNNWLGRGQYANDDSFHGKISEFRIYDAALTADQLKTSIAMGENTTYLEP